uniref:Dynein heavy chain 5, axonemal-like n=1 Tax=Diabrotica virgifera virgifera TaxID=50390 RepID=A0A6P7GZS7_DIAVI
CLVQFRQLRRENEFVGPVVEIEYWRRQLTRFTSVTEFLETEDCAVFIDFIKFINNRPVIKIWRKHVDAVYETRNESSDNVKYLHSMEKFWEPLYRLDPPDLQQHIPPLLNAIRMVFTTSKFYNSTGNVTAILVKISNQLIKRCRIYLNCNETKTIWRQPKQIVLDKIKTCLDLYLRYYQCYKGNVPTNIHSALTPLPFKIFIDEPSPTFRPIADGPSFVSTFKSGTLPCNRVA